jgi:hypothetical protein
MTPGATVHYNRNFIDLLRKNWNTAQCYEKTGTQPTISTGTARRILTARRENRDFKRTILGVLSHPPMCFALLPDNTNCR